MQMQVMDHFKMLKKTIAAYELYCYRHILTIQWTKVEGEGGEMAFYKIITSKTTDSQTASHLRN